MVRLCFQADCNLVIYGHYDPVARQYWPIDCQPKTVFAINTYGRNCTLMFQADDRNVVIIDSQGKPLWDFRAAGSGASELRFQTQGNLVLYDDAQKQLLKCGIISPE
eukprot:CAMPEP_0197658200 /NCGR_PEP_ID=MMETSP1338-20131121/45097_1 /TAXON_ID=43686 ORGANISM="Pelagodinium beii, Strain RCC1491" /NCGR_SAMPLE_ID=MMETSP1338 /ASSEMBLY_ACC=CAM_ASM_000754 /LENGTH=106 /DNA_ID=CAMNT_0043234747 /DNA_START=290 /DNA_END=607 /DNA_ORIENTATION=-